MKTDKNSLKTIEEIIPKLKEIDPEKDINDYTPEELMLIMKFMYCHELYNTRFVEAVHIKCQFKSIEFYEYLKKDVYFNEQIIRYNTCHESDIDFWTYVMNFHEAALYNILYSRTNHLSLDTPPEDNVYTFTFYFVKVGAPELYDFVYNKIPELRNDTEDENIQPATLDDKLFGDDEEYFKKMKQFIETVKKEKYERRMLKRRKGKKIEKYDTNGNLVCTYKDRQDCMKHEGMSKQCLSNVLTGKRKTYKGYIYNEID